MIRTETLQAYWTPVVSKTNGHMRFKMRQMANSQIKTMMNAAIQFFGFLFKKSDRAFALHSSKISLGMILMRRIIPVGRIIKSSRYPITGIKSGMKSMGLKA